MPAPGETNPLTIDEVNDAIRAILTGQQRYRLRDGSEYTRANLADLRELRQGLLAQAQLAELDGGVGNGGYFPVAFREPH